jgi:hypothetical protein
MLNRVLLILLTFLISCQIHPNTGNAQNIITVDVNQVIKPVNKNVLGLSLEWMTREVWREGLDLNDDNLKNLLIELNPGVVNIVNSSLGIPFYKENTGPKQDRLSMLGIMERMQLSSDPVGASIYNKVKNVPAYQNPPHKNYDDWLQFFESIPITPNIATRIPIIFTAQYDPFKYLKLNIDPLTGSNLVSYLNDNDDTDWGKLRAGNGHISPYRLKYYVLGNELWVNAYYAGMSVKQIGSQIKKFAQAMKAADPTVNLGMVLLDYAYQIEFYNPNVVKRISTGVDLYNNKLLQYVSNDIDYVVFHTYCGIGEDNIASGMQLSDNLWKYVLSRNYLRDKYKVGDRYHEIAQAHNPNMREIFLSTPLITIIFMCVLGMPV